MAKRDLAGKVAWITGIGQGAAEKLAEAGCHVILSGRVCINEITFSPTYNRLYMGQGGSMAPDAE